jgi:hypothetical protein
MRMNLAVLVIVGWSTVAAADGTDRNVMGGPILGISRAEAGWHFQLGVEGGVGIGPERLNLGFERRASKLFAYAELDPWLLVGASLGAGVDEDGQIQPVLGIWEGVPLRQYPCGNGRWRFIASFSVGVRYTGAWEVYAAPKAGGASPDCVD